MLEQLEPRMLLSASPSPFEQEMLWLINDMRTDPADHLDHFITGYGAPATSSDPDIDSALDYFDVVGSALQADWSLLTATAPLAWSPLLDNAAEFHSQYMIEEDDQEHEFPPDGPTLGERIDATGYVWTNIAENIYAYSDSALHGHAGFVVDWGYGANGMQNPPGHRNTIMNPTYIHVGIASIAESDPNTDVGPYVVTQDFGKSWPDEDAYLVGTIWADANSDGKFDGGEGFGGVTVTATGPSTHSTTSWASGGYQLQLPPGTYDVSISGGAFSGTFAQQATIGAENILLDANPQSASQVVGRYVFYNNSELDGNDPGPGPSDDGAIDAGKSPLLPGQTAGPANRSGYSRGINGIMIDIDQLPGTVTAADFEFKVNSPGDPNNWVSGPGPGSVTVRPGEGDGGADRITIIWSDGAIKNQWLEVAMKANSNTGLEVPDLFYFSSAVADIDGDGQVDGGDYGAFVSQFGQAGAAGSLGADLNINGRVDLRDFAIMRDRFGTSVADPVFPALSPGPSTGSEVIEYCGADSQDEVDLTEPVASPKPEFIVTDGNAPYANRTFDLAVGKYYYQYLTSIASRPFRGGVRQWDRPLEHEPAIQEALFPFYFSLNRFFHRDWLLS